MHHEPSGFLRNAEIASNLIRADPVFAVANHPHGHEPLVERERRILKDRVDLDGKLLPALFTLPPLLRSKPVVVFMAASRAFWFPIGPTHLSHDVDARLLIAEIADGLL